MSAMQQMLLAGGIPPVALTWQANYNVDTATVTPGSNVFTATSANAGSNGGVFSGLLPAAGDWHFDVTLSAGFSSTPSRVGFLGISNAASGFVWSDNAYHKTWYFNGQWKGTGTEYVAPPVPLDAATYRIGLNRSNGRLYIKSSASATVAVATIPSGSNLYACLLDQSGYPFPGATIVGGLCYSGSGGLW